MEITIDLSSLYFLVTESPIKVIWYIFIHGGWLVLLAGILFLLFYTHLIRKRKKYMAGIEQTLLAIDIPKDNEQSLVAVEQIFASLAGIRSKINLYEKYWQGRVQPWFSLEIISLEGYIQFLIRTPIKFKDLVEAAIYAQYPEAEITEVEDYVNLIPDDVHDLKSDFNIYATEFKLAKESAYPIKTYKSFEHSLTQMFVDPMASLLEVMSKISKGEQLAIQLLITPVNDDWKERGYKIIKKLIGEKEETTRHIGDRIVETSVRVLDRFSEGVLRLWGDIDDSRRDDSSPNLVQYLTPGERLIVESIQNKLSQIGFAVKFRLYYLAHNEVFQKGRGVNSLFGAINQFNTTNLNALIQNKRIATKVNYFFVKSRISRRQKKFVRNYKSRSAEKGSTPIMLCLEELATLFHFPTITVKAPLVKKTEAKKAEPPTALPVDFGLQKSAFKEVQKKVTPADEESDVSEAPSDEEFKISESLPEYDFNNDYFEEKFAKDKTQIKTPQETPDLKSKTESPPSNLPIVK